MLPVDGLAQPQCNPLMSVKILFGCPFKVLLDILISLESLQQHLAMPLSYSSS
jgi:hypothetical protein